MIKNDRQIIKNSLTNSKTIVIKPINIKYKVIKEDLNILKLRFSINTILSIILLAVLIYVLATYNSHWKLFFYLASWSYLMNIYYIISVTFIDFIYLIYNKFLKSYNNFVRNYFIRICFPFGLMSVSVYWELVLLGKNFQKFEHGINDICANIFLNGIVQLFLFFDMFASHHIYKYNRINDIIILTIIIAIYYLLVCLGKYLDIFEPYNFLPKSDVRQICGAGIIVYVLLLNGYIVFDLLAFCYFEDENVNINISCYEDKNELSSRLNSINNSTFFDENLTFQPINIKKIQDNSSQLNSIVNVDNKYKK